MAKRDIKRSHSEQTVHRYSYAIQLLKGAEAVSSSNLPSAVVFAPAYLLLCFSLENALACFLICVKHANPADYKSHDLLRAVKKSREHDLVLSEAQRSLVERLTPLHMEHVFRYPEKIDAFDLPAIKTSCAVVREILRDVQTVLAMKGFDLIDEVEKLPAADGEQVAGLPQNSETAAEASA